MKTSGLFLLFATLAYAAPAKASTAEAREVARLYNCNPKKIEVIETKLGSPSQTIYRAQCNMPKVSGNGSASKAESVIIRCNGNLCDMLGADSAAK